MSILPIKEHLVKILGNVGYNELAEIVDSVRQDSVTKSIEQVETRFEKRLVEVKSELELKMEKNKSEIIKWMFVFWIGQIAVFIAIAHLIIK